MTGQGKHLSNRRTHTDTDLGARGWMITSIHTHSSLCRISGSKKTPQVIQHGLHATHIYITLSRRTHMQPPAMCTLQVFRSALLWNLQWPLQQTSRAPVGATDGMPRPQHVERSVLERSAVVITYWFACSACYHQLCRGLHRKCWKFKAWIWAQCLSLGKSGG